MTGDRVVNLWYQEWPSSSGPSELKDAIKHYRVGDSGTRPDVIIEFLDSGVATRLIILELKASSSSGYVSSGFNQLLGYLRDRPQLTTVSPSGWLVAPYHGREAREPNGRALWLVSADNVAPAVVGAATTPVVQTAPN